MAKLKRDERVCPFCAETIKASAIKCRFCQSEVTPILEPETELAAPAPAKVAAKKAPAQNPPRKTGAGGAPTPGAKAAATEVVHDLNADRPSVAERLSPIFKNLTLVLATLVALAAAGVGTLWWQAEQGSASTTASGLLVGDDARTEVVISAADLATRTLSYDYKTFDNDLETARARMTKSFRKEYDATMSQVKANTEKNKIVLQATAVASAIITATEHKAKVLVFLNQTTTAGVGKAAKQQASQNSLVVTLTRGDGDWAISKLTALG